MSALYQRARPVTFDEVVGQEHVKDVLTSAVARGLTGHAYLFSGPRGVGKTTTARLLAMAVNCEREDPTERPCGTCESCRLVQGGGHPDVIELDAASNNSVEDVRDLRERVGLASLRGGTRVWILDEAHMLTRAAANALLKTLEEPPPGLMFVLATTEPEKLPPTILSRCQHFRFRRLTDGEILGKLGRLCEAAGVSAEEAALSLVARAAEGAMRDAESLLERLLVGGEAITAAAVEDALGLPPRERLAALADALVAGDLARLLPQAGDLYRAGFAPRTVAEQLARTLRDRLVGALASGAADEARLVALLHALDEEQERFGRRDDLYALEVALIKASRAGRPAAAEDRARPAREAAPAAAPHEGTASTRQPAPAAPPEPAERQRPAAAPAAAPESAPPPPPPFDPHPGAGRRPAADAAAEPGAHAGGGPGAQTGGAAEQDADAPPPSASAAGATPPAQDGAGERRSFSWHAVRMAATPQLKAFLQPAKVEESGGRVTLEYGESWRFHYEQVLARQEELEELVTRVAGPGYTVELKGPRGAAAGRRRASAAPAAQPRPPAEPAAPRRHGAGTVERAGERAGPAVAAAPEPTGGPAAPAASAPEAAVAAGGPAAAEPVAPAEAAAPEDEEPLPPPDDGYEELPPGFWDDEGRDPPPEDEPGPAAGSAGASSLAELQRLFPGRVIEFKPHAAPDEALGVDAAPDAPEGESQGYDDEGQDRLGFGVRPDDR
ncbi:MAG TPA: DNA polymerase III subunit gamma/tau [Trueperaceae bacterium]|nr:DNA polymerase III subunit gamma/tau [Trueperaceae bacterium]